MPNYSKVYLVYDECPPEYTDWWDWEPKVRGIFDSYKLANAWGEKTFGKDYYFVTEWEVNRDYYKEGK